MRLKVDKDNDALYFRLDEASIVESEEVQHRSPAENLCFCHQDTKARRKAFQFFYLCDALCPRVLVAMLFSQTSSLILDFNADGNVVGIEILHLSRRMTPEQLK